MVTLEQSKKEYNTLSVSDQQGVKQILVSVRQRYILSGIKVDVPYFFFSIHRPMFQPGEEKEFLDITDADEFGLNAVYLISRFINKARRGTPNGKEKEGGK